MDTELASQKSSAEQTSPLGASGGTQIKRKRPYIPLLEREMVLGYAMLVPALLFILVFKAYPFALGIWFSLTSRYVGDVGEFVGLSNYTRQLGDTIFWRAAWNTMLFTTLATIFKAVLGMLLALILARKFRFARITRSIVLLPFIVPTVLSGLAWLWMFDSTYSVFNWILTWLWQMDIDLFGLSIKDSWPGRVRILWLGDPVLAMTSIIIVNVWRGMPFFAITFLAGLQTVPQDLYDAGNIDGTNGWQRFWKITLPMIKPIAVVVMVFSIVITFADFEIVYVLTRGGPYNSTHLLATLAFQMGMDAGNLGEGAAIALFMLPILGVLIIWQLLYLRREANNS